MKVTLAIRRFNPEKNDAPYTEKFHTVAEPTDRILDLLIDIAKNHDGTLTFRRSCAHGVCGSDAMRINGVERLACKTLLRDVAENENDVINIEPLRHLPVQRDLMVDHEPFFEKYRSVSPYLSPKEKPGEKERIQSQKQRAIFDDATKCINCSACYSACPVLEKNPRFLGPAAIVQASRFVFDSRDTGLDTRVDRLDTADGVWACENHFECTRVCPREIKVTKMINMTKRAIKKYREARGESTAEPPKPEKNS